MSIWSAIPWSFMYWMDPQAHVSGILVKGAVLLPDDADVPAHGQGGNLRKRVHHRGLRVRDKDHIALLHRGVPVVGAVKADAWVKISSLKRSTGIVMCRHRPFKSVILKSIILIPCSWQICNTSVLLDMFSPPKLVCSRNAFVIRLMISITFPYYTMSPAVRLMISITFPYYTIV